jgi:cysteinyl-tRNA synthetase
MHNNFLNLNDEKMSKSLGNIITAREFNEKYHPEILKYIMLSSHYRALFNLNQEKVHQSISALARMYSALREADHLGKTLAADGSANSSLLKAMKEAESKMEKAMDDDFNTVEFLAHIFEVVRLYNGLNLPKKSKDVNTGATAKAFYQWLLSWGKMAALFQENPELLLQRFDNILLLEKNLKREDIDRLVAQREEARKNKDWKKSDEFRVELDALGVAIFDRPEGVSWEMKKT